MSFWTYLLHCADRSYHTGHTEDLDRRVGEYQIGAVRGFTDDRRPVELVWAEAFETLAEAQAAEARIRALTRDQKEALIVAHWDRLKALSVPPSQRAQRANPIPAALDAVLPLPDEEAPDASASLMPAIVLVRPQLGENIGKAARAMLNFGLTELRLVAPRDGWPNASAFPAASGADSVLEQAKVYESVADAVADCRQVFATTVRKRGVTKPVVTPEQAALDIRAFSHKSAILFGPERSGLESDDVAIARTIITVPINPKFQSLNLAQAVMLVVYEWSKGEALASPPLVEIEPPAPQDELDGMIGQLDAMLVKAGFFHPPDRTHVTKRALRTLLTKPGWNSNEVRTLRGVLSSLAHPRDRS